MIQKLGNWYVNWRGWHTDRKLLIIESDDWGTIRMPSREAYKALSKKNSLIEKDAFARLDTLANKTDLSCLFGVLSSFKDQHGRHPVITANTIVANPDFDKIKADNFQDYHYEPFYETIFRQPEGKEVLKLWGEGMRQGLFHPQLHGREHVHVTAWLKLLQTGNQDFHNAFEWRCFGIPYRSEIRNKRRNLLAAFDHHGLEGEQDFQRIAIKEAAQIFARYFGYTSRSFIAPAYIWHPVLEETLRAVKVQILQGLALQYIPQKSKYQKRVRFTGQTSKLKMRQVIRNCFFEPGPQPGKDWENLVLKQVKLAFNARKPAILSTHRLNFIGGLNPINRDTNLIQLRNILQRIQKNWPTVEFLSTDELDFS